MTLVADDALYDAALDLLAADATGIAAHGTRDRRSPHALRLALHGPDIGSVVGGLAFSPTHVAFFLLPAFRGFGLMASVLGAALPRVSDRYPSGSVLACVLIDNVASRRTLEAAGFVFRSRGIVPPNRGRSRGTALTYAYRWPP